MIQMNNVHRAGLATILFENLTSQFGFVIGRANKRYTLWKYTREDRNGIPYMNIAYMQVLSDKLHKVEQRFPGIFICEELRGEHKMEFEGWTVGKNGKRKPASAPKTLADFISLPFGQFRGVAFREVSDWYWCKLANSESPLTWTDAWGEEFDFTELIENKCRETGCQKLFGAWYTAEYLAKPACVCWNANNSEGEKKEYFEQLAKELGCTKLMYRWYPGIETENEKPWQATARQILPHIEKGEAFSFVPHFNGNEFWFGLPITFRPEDKDSIHTYYGSSYFLKVTNKKGVKVNKRVKGKTIEVLEYTISEDNDGKPFIIVDRFNIL